MKSPLDALGGRLKVGVVVPSTNTIAQPEMDAVRLPGVSYHIGRIPIAQNKISIHNYLDYVEAMRAGLETAIDQVKTAGIDVLILGVSLETFWGGLTRSEELKEKFSAYAGIPVILGSDAMAAALRVFGAGRIALLTPHMPEGDQQVRNWLTESGFDVVRLHGLQCESPRAIAQVSEATIRAQLVALDGDDIDALVQVGTNLAGSAVCAEAERWLGKPALAINTVSAWYALRGAGITDKLHGRGGIFEQF
ncbi:MAG: Asp/Glu racemase [Pseudomonadota bacterium]